MTVALRSSGFCSAMRWAIAPSIWLRITPLLPRAPSSAPRLKAASALPKSAPLGSSPAASPDRVARGGDGEVHVGAGVAVGDGVDVEGVDLLAGPGEGVGGDVDEAQHGGELDHARLRCFHGVPAPSP